MLIATILLLSVTSLRGKLLKTTHTEECSVAIFDLNRKKSQFNSKQIIQMIQPKIIDYFPTYSYIVDTICYLLYMQYT